MARSVLLLLAGAMAGAVTVYVLGSSPSSEGPSPSPSPAEAEQSLPPQSVPAPAGTVAAQGYAAERLAIFEQAADVADPFEIEALIESTLDEPASRLRELRLNVLLQRYAEIDPRSAVEFARTRYLDQALLAPLFKIWAQTDADAAIAELALMTPPARRREIALAMLDIFGNDADGIERVAEALPAADRISFEADAMLLRAETDPTGVLRDVLAMQDYYGRTLLLSRLAAVAALVDPRGALEQAAAIDEYAQRRSFLNAVLSTWAAQDPEAVFAWLETAEIRDLPESAAVYQALARDDPDRLFAMLDGLPPTVQTNAKRAAMQVLAETDPNAAIAQLATMPPGQERDQLLTTIGQVYGRQNPDLALAWVRTLPPAQAQNVMRSVIMGIMNVNPERAVDIVIAELEGAGQGRAFADGNPLSLLMSMSTLAASAAASGNGADFGRIADRLLTVNNPQVSSAITSMVGTWAQQSPDEALRWALANVERLDRQAFEQMAQGIARADSARALGMLNQLPPAQRPQWLAGVVQQMALNDANRAIEVVGQYRGQPEYAPAYNAMVLAVAQNDPPRAAGLLRDAPPGNPAQSTTAYMQIATTWSRSDPVAAADWAVGITDPQAQQRAISSVTQNWAQRDAPAAERWLRDMSPGATRDAAANSFVTAVAQTGRFDPQMLSIFSTEQAAQNAAASAARAIGRTNAQEARRLLAAHVTDERLRQSVEDYLARSGGVGGSTTLPAGIVIF